MKYAPIFFIIILLGCQTKIREQSQPEQAVEVDSTDNYKGVDFQYDYTNLYGVYDHQSTTSNFKAVVSLRENGLDLYGTLSVVQGSCKAETESVIVMAEQTEDWFIGFADIENCVMQFTLYLKEPKIDIKEVMLCTIHGPTCSFEGIYVKRKAE
jgi:hypothetical protein